MADIDEDFEEALHGPDAHDALEHLVASGARLTCVGPLLEAVELGRTDLVDLVLFSQLLR